MRINKLFLGNEMSFPETYHGLFACFHILLSQGVALKHCSLLYLCISAYISLTRSTGKTHAYLPPNVLDLTYNYLVFGMLDIDVCRTVGLEDWP